MIVYYHKNCLDGLTAAWVVRKIFQDGDYFPMDYDDEPPTQDMIKGQDVYLVDFSFPPEVLVKMCESAYNVIVIDHHKSAIKAIEDYFSKNPTPYNLVTVLDVERSGAGLAWREFGLGEEEIPYLVKYVEDHDLWRFEYGDRTKAICAGICTFPLTFNTLDMLHARSEEDLYKEGRTALRMQQQMVDWHIENCVKLIETETGHRVPLINAPRYIASHVADRLTPDYPYVIVYYDLEDKRHVSMRSSYGKGFFANDPVDLSILATRFGGGGHPGAASFRIPIERNQVPLIPKRGFLSKTKDLINDSCSTISDLFENLLTVLKNSD